jgi:hypothetical protein
MSEFSKRALFWAPRALSIMFIGFLSLFALDVFGHGVGFWRTLVALVMHLIPSFVLIAALILAWKWEWIGAVLYGGAAGLYIYWVVPRRLPPAVKVSWILTMAGPALFIAALFLANWIKRRELHS